MNVEIEKEIFPFITCGAQDGDTRRVFLDMIVVASFVALSSIPVPEILEWLWHWMNVAKVMLLIFS